jgi:hypothetical protein
MALTKVTSNGITDSAVDTAKIANCGVAAADIGANAVTSAKIDNGTITADDLASSLDLSSKTVTLPPSATAVVDQNVALLGFKMAVNDGLTVFNLIDGVVDEFHDESGTDEGEGSNDLYNSDDFYINSTSPTGTLITSAVSGFDMGNVYNSTGTAGTAPQNSGCGAGNFENNVFGTFTVPCGATNVNFKMWGGGGAGLTVSPVRGGSGGFVQGCLAVTASQVLHVGGGEGAGYSISPNCGYNQNEGAGFAHVDSNHPQSEAGAGTGPATGPSRGGTGGAGASFLSSVTFANLNTAPEVFGVGAGGGGATSSSGYSDRGGGPGGGLVGHAGGWSNCGSLIGAQTSGPSDGGGGGDQEQGGQGGGGSCNAAAVGKLFAGGSSIGNNSGGGGAGYYGGGGGNDQDGGGGGSSFYGHPQVTNGSTQAGTSTEAGGAPGSVPNPGPVPQGGWPTTAGDSNPGSIGIDGFQLLTASAPASATSTTIVSNAFTAGSAPSTSRIVVFQENVDSITLNTDIIASISRDGGTTFTTATLTDSGYVTGSSGQRILTGTATISGQPSGTSMRWKLALANNQSKIHGVSLQWK